MVILIIGILAAIAIPSFLDQTHKAYDAKAKELVRAASQAAETYETDHSGNYGGITRDDPARTRALAADSPKAQQRLPPDGAKNTNRGRATWSPRSRPATKDTFTITRTGNGEFLRTCTGSKTSGGCRTGSW